MKIDKYLLSRPKYCDQVIYLIMFNGKFLNKDADEVWEYIDSLADKS